MVTVAPPGAPAVRLSEAAARTFSSTIRDLLRQAATPGVLSLAGGLPAPELLPVARVLEVVDRLAEELGPALLQYGPSEGVDVLRECCAVELGASPSEVLVTTGSQQALDLVARALVDPGSPVVVEAPTYLGALQSLSSAGARIVPVPGDADGLDVARLESLLAGGLRPRLVYVVTELANPSGATLSIERRRRLAALSQRHGFVVVEDDPYGALRFDGTTRPRIRSFGGNVVSLGTASKTIAPGLRVGWLAARGDVLDALIRLKQSADLHTPGLDQHVVAELLADHGWRAAHLRRARSLYEARARALSEALRPGMRLAPVDGGLFVWAEVPAGAPDSLELARRAIAAGVAVVPGVAFYPPSTPDGASDGDGARRLRLSFATLAEADLAEAGRRLVALTAGAS